MVLPSLLTSLIWLLEMSFFWKLELEFLLTVFLSKVKTSLLMNQFMLRMMEKNQVQLRRLL